MHKLLLAGVSAVALAATAGGAFAQDLVYPKGEGAFSWDALDEFAASHTGLEGQSVTVWGPWREGGDQEMFESVIAYFEDATGINVEYGSSENYEQQAQIDAAAGSPANVTILPQPGLLADMASKGYLVPLGDDLKARVESERLPRGANPTTHLKLGRGGIADVEWTVQLLQMRHGHEVEALRTTDTLVALRAAAAAGLVASEDAAVLEEAWRLVSRIRNGIVLLRAKPAESMVEQSAERAGLAHLLGYRQDESERMVDDYLRITRQARSVIERVFWES